MLEYNLMQGIVDNKIFDEFQEQRGDGLFNHAANSCCIDDFLAIAYILCPDIVEVGGYIFLADLFSSDGDEALEKVKALEAQFNSDKTRIEQWVNSRSLIEFFSGYLTKSLDNVIIVDEFAKVLLYYWRRRVKELFPERNIVVEVANGIAGKTGLTITMYEQLAPKTATSTR